MSANWGNYLKVSIFGESHGVGIGVVLDGLPAGLALDMDEILFEMGRRAPGHDETSTPRKEEDVPEILSGVFAGKATGAPLAAVIRNTDTRSRDYGEKIDALRPGHADYTGMVRFFGHNDFRGGGHFSGRLTAPIVFAGAVCKQWLKKEAGVRIYAHALKIAGISDDPIEGAGEETLMGLRNRKLPVINPEAEASMRASIMAAKREGDSVGGVIECMAAGVSAGLGAPFFDSAEAVLSHLLFSVPAVKGVEFGEGFAAANLTGSQMNDEMVWEDGQVRLLTNHCGGIMGGITCGREIVFRAAIRPTATIAKEQRTVSMERGENIIMRGRGRHDPCIVPRAVPVIEAVTAIGLAELWKERLSCRI